MGLFDSAPSYSDITRQANTPAGTGGKLRYLHQGVFPMTFVGAETSEATNGNIALVMQYDSGFTTRSGEPNILYKHYYLLDKGALPSGQKLILQDAILTVRAMLFSLFGLEFEQVSTIREAHEISKLKGMARQIARRLLKRPEQDRQVAGTVDYERNPNREGRYFLSLEWVNPIAQLENRQKAFRPKENPNPPSEQQQALPVPDNPYLQNEPDDLPF